jgi:sarcosine oxidase subunit beta
MKADVVVIGGGVIGLSTAYYLAKSGVEKIIVAEKKYLGSGASGRCAGGIREQFSSKPSIRLAKKSLDMYERLSDELNFNILFRQGGYLFLAFDEESMEELERDVKLQNSLNVDSVLLEPEEVKEIVPELNIDGLLGGSFNMRDGIAFPFPVVWGFARKCRKMGVEIRDFSEVSDILVRDGTVRGVKLGNEIIGADFVVNAAGGWSSQVYHMAGLEPYNKPVKHEILATEPMKPFLEPMVIDLTAGLYFNQSMRGEIIGGIGIPESPSYQMGSSLEFLEAFASRVTKLMPKLKGVKVLRQWAGLYDMTPDSLPILGETEIEGFIQANGFSGHGFMLAPIVGKLIAKLIATGESDPLLEPFKYDRFKEMDVEPEHMVVG